MQLAQELQRQQQEQREREREWQERRDAEQRQWQDAETQKARAWQAQQNRANLASVRPLENAERAVRVGSAHDAPSGARRDGRNQPTLVGIGIEQQE